MSSHPLSRARSTSSTARTLRQRTSAPASEPCCVVSPEARVCANESREASPRSRREMASARARSTRAGVAPPEEIQSSSSSAASGAGSRKRSSRSGAGRVEGPELKSARSCEPMSPPPAAEAYGMLSPRSRDS